MIIESNGRGLKVTIEESELASMEGLLNIGMDVIRDSCPKWVYQLDAAIVAKINDNKGETGL